MKKVDLEEMLLAMHDGKLPEVRLNAEGQELLDSTPMAPPLGYKKQPSMVEIVRNMVRSERLAMEALSEGLETFEEADDFDVGEDFDPTSPYEIDFEPDVRELRRRHEEEKALLSAESDKQPEKKGIPAEKVAHAAPKAAKGAKNVVESDD